MELGPVSPPADLPNLESDSPLTDEPVKSSIPMKSTIPNGPAIPDLVPSTETVPPGSLPEPPLDVNDLNAAPGFPSDLPQSEPEIPPVDAKPL